MYLKNINSCIYFTRYNTSTNWSGPKKKTNWFRSCAKFQCLLFGEFWTQSRN